MQKPNKRSVVGGAIGNTLEWYDFTVFGFFAPAISTQFFPSDDAIASLISTFGVFAAGYLMRPLGGIIFGRIGDRFGRKRALQISIVAMAIPTTLMAALPTHAEVGTLAAALLIVLRLGQGVSVGGEFIGSICYLVEVAPANRRGLFGSFAIFSTIGGMLAGSAVAALLHALMSNEQIQDWGWRIPFLGGLVIGFVGWWLRRRLDETPDFVEVARAGQIERGPVTQVVREMPGRIFRLVCMMMLLAVAIYTLFIWMPTYLTHIIKPPVPHALLINTGAMIIFVALVPVAGHLADRIGAKAVLAGAALATAIFVYPLFVWIDTGALIAAIVGLAIFAIISAGIQGPVPFAMVSMFPTRVRYSGIAVGYNVSLAAFGGTAPLAATWLISVTGDLAAPAWYLLAVAIISGVAVLGFRPHPDAKPAT